MSELIVGNIDQAVGKKAVVEIDNVWGQEHCRVGIGDKTKDMYFHFKPSRDWSQLRDDVLKHCESTTTPVSLKVNFGRMGIRLCTGYVSELEKNTFRLSTNPPGTDDEIVDLTEKQKARDSRG